MAIHCVARVQAYSTVVRDDEDCESEIASAPDWSAAGRSRRQRLTTSVPDIESVHERIETFQILRATTTKLDQPSAQPRYKDAHKCRIGQSTHQVVGRLVEQEDVRPLHRQDGERDSGLLSSREGADQLQRSHALREIGFASERSSPCLSTSSRPAMGRVPPAIRQKAETQELDAP